MCIFFNPKLMKYAFKSFIFIMACNRKTDDQKISPTSEYHNTPLPLLRHAAAASAAQAHVCSSRAAMPWHTCVMPQLNFSHCTSDHKATSAPGWNPHYLQSALHRPEKYSMKFYSVCGERLWENRL